jgi:hypothetical protein
MKSLLRDSPQVRLAFWPQLTLNTRSDFITQRPDDGRATLLEYCRASSSSSWAGNAESSSTHFEAVLLRNNDGAGNGNSNLNKNADGIAAACTYEYLVLRLRIAQRDFESVSPVWVKEVWGHWKSVVEPLKVDIVVIGNNGGAVSFNLI